MRTLKGNVSAAIAGLMAGAVLLGLCANASAQVMTSDETAGLIVFPKVIVDTTGVLGTPTDTLIQITNTDLDPSGGAAAVECNWVNATGQCGVRAGGSCPNSGIFCDTNADCAALGLECIPCWSETDFGMVLTPGQPIAFRASTGLDLPCFGVVLPPGCLSPNEGGVSNVPSNPFRGELKCYQVAGFTDATPTNENDLKGEATIISSDGTELTAAAYNAVGFQATTAGGTSATGPLCLGVNVAGAALLSDPCGAGSCAKTYAGCPGVLILDHFFWNAPSPLGVSQVRTNLTLAPCSESLFGNLGNQTITAAQMLIYNEFEQRYSTSTRVQCYKDIPLADIDTTEGPADDASSVFAVGVQGTLSGQTRIRPVEGLEDNVGHGLIGVAQEFYFLPGATGALIESAAVNLHAQGEREQGDAICR